MNVFHGTPFSYVAAAVEASEANSAARAARSGVANVDERLERTLLACEAMWSLLREKLSVTDLDLLDRINALDLSDGKLDGKIRKPAVTCPQCRRTMARRSPKCMYCGKEVMHDPFV